MQKRLFLAGVIVSILALALAAQPILAQDGPPPAGQNGHGAGQHRPLPKPVNLKVLPKDMPPEEVISIMKGFAGSLGVECNFCHAVNPQTHKLDFASDAKDDKGIARTMMLMTRDINEKFMSQVNDPDAKPADKHVTCATCHRGHSMPQHFVPPPEHHRPGMAPMGAPPGGEQHPG